MWSKVEVSKEKIIRPCLLNKNQSRVADHETMRIVKSWGQFLCGGGVERRGWGCVSKIPKESSCSCKQKAGPEPREPGPFCTVKIKRSGDTAGLLI